MKYLAMLLLLVSATAQAATEKIDVTWYEDFPQMEMDPDMAYWFFECTGGGEPVGPFMCSEGGIHLRGLQGWSCLMNEQMEVIATTWFRMNANWDAEYTGPVYGEWKVFMGSECSMEVAFSPHESYFVGTFTGKRRMDISSMGYPVWTGSWKLDGYGVGDFDGVQFKSVNDYVTYHPLVFDYESIPGYWGEWCPGCELPVDPGDPEGTIHGRMIIEYDD